ncbi:patatin-like phospholipase family protein [Henriciella sp. AS95]|uniref:patatin-like phospholipase family protein n=1 Tax=Henriciella sp. AS95 TaxID=3135782 RepID=UPI00317723E9
MARSRKKSRPISLALQGGGAHGAFTWGVLERLTECEDIEIKSITATSAGAMNAAAYISGYQKNGSTGAREALLDFWQDISRRGAALYSMKPHHIATEVLGSNPLLAWTPHSFATAMSSFLSPYDFNPFDLNPLRETVETMIDFEAVRASPIQLFVAATNVETGKVRIFEGEELTSEAILASACLPNTFRAVEIDNVPYWDGGYLGNPSLFPLFYTDAPRDVLLVILNPLERKGTPKTAGAIQDRLNEITFNAALLGELRAIAFVQKLLGQNWLSKAVQSRYRKLNIHAIRGGEMLRDLSLETKYDTSWPFLSNLREKGRDYADEWLGSCLHHVGKQSSIDIHETFLDGVES